MALEAVQERYIPRDNYFYRKNYRYILLGIILLIFLFLASIGLVLYQLMNKPLPVFYATQANGEKMLLTPYEQPNLMPATILRWASKAATAAYTFDFSDYRNQINAAKPYFTESGWQQYLKSVNALLDTIVRSKLFVNGIVSGAPVISNEGPVPGVGYVWRIQIPFLVTYQSSETPYQTKYYVLMSIVKVPTSVNPNGIGIDQFVMIGRS